MVGVAIAIDGDGDIEVVIGKSSFVLVVHVVVDRCGAVLVIVGRVDADQQRSD